MTTYKFGDVVLIHFPQSGGTARKQRPGIVVLDIGDADLAIVPVTSQPRSQAGDIALVNQKETGLIRPSWMRLSKVSTLLKRDVIRTLGRLPESDRTQLCPRLAIAVRGFHDLIAHVRSQWYCKPVQTRDTQRWEPRWLSPVYPSL